MTLHLTFSLCLQRKQVETQTIITQFPLFAKKVCLSKLNVI